jgi:hypothetical protein
MYFHHHGLFDIPQDMCGYDDGYDDGYCDATHHLPPHHQPPMFHHGHVHPESFPDLEDMCGLGAHYGSIDVYQNGIMLAVAMSLSGALDLVRRGRARVTSDRSIEVIS